MADPILDNPVWNGLRTGNLNLAKGNNEVGFFSPEVSISAGLQEYSERNFKKLYEMLPTSRKVTLFSDQDLKIPSMWFIMEKRTLFQMVYNNLDLKIPSGCEIIDLQPTHIPQMITLAEICRPGPFFKKTFDFGGYKGIFDNGQLISMAGYRFQPGVYKEISAVCTHINYLKRGIAGTLINALIRDIIENSSKPMLHVASTNANAISLYQKMGFKIRREIYFYTLEK